MRLANAIGRWTGGKRYFAFEALDGLTLYGGFDDYYSLAQAANAGSQGAFVELLEDLARQREGAIVDVGANLGSVCAPLASRLPDRTTIAFEPMQDTALRGAAAAYAGNLRQLHYFQCAVGDRDGHLELQGDEQVSDQMTAVSGVDMGPGACTTKVRSITLDSFAHSYPVGPVALLKIDVEGFEPQALAGAQGIIARDAPAIVFEYMPRLAAAAGWGPKLLASMIGRDHPYTFRCYTDLGDEVSFPPPTPADPDAFFNVVASPSATPKTRRTGSSQ